MKKVGFFLFSIILLSGFSSLFAATNSKITITPMENVTISGSKVVIAPAQENQEYTISGNFSGQIVVKTKNTVIKLKNARLENKKGEAALFAEAKIEVSCLKDTENYISSSGKNDEKTAALQCKKDLVLGGSGKLFVQGNVCHGIKADDVKLKGSGTFDIRGTKNGSALKCESFTVESEKTFSAYFSDSKNGIKADETIEIASGNFYFKNNKVALKTDTSEDDAKKSKTTKGATQKTKHKINLSGGTFYIEDNEKLYATEDGAYNASGAKIIK